MRDDATARRAGPGLAEGTRGWRVVRVLAIAAAMLVCAERAAAQVVNFIHYFKKQRRASDWAARTSFGARP